MDALALTDRDGLYGAIKHVRACHEAGIGAIIRWIWPCLIPGLMPGPIIHRVVVLAKRDGWSDLCRLVTAPTTRANAANPGHHGDGGGSTPPTAG